MSKLLANYMDKKAEVERVATPKRARFQNLRRAREAAAVQQAQTSETVVDAPEGSEVDSAG